MGIAELAFFVIYVAVIVVPVSRILGKAGFSGWWAVCALIPLLNLLMLWIFAFSQWPQEGNSDV